jgi:Fe-S oxidoreductase
VSQLSRTGQEQHSTRGRARLLWEMLAGALREEGFQSEAVHEALDLCLSCKACKTECPVQVDMAQYKSEFLAQKYKGKLHPLHHYVFGFADKMARLGSLTPALTNFVLSKPDHQPADQAHCGRGARAADAATGGKELQEGARQRRAG